MNLRQLTRIRWGVRAALVLGVATSVAANVLHANQNPISQAIAAWPPLALLLTVELISRVPVHRRWLATVRLIATACISGIAAWVSYWHMAGVAARYGETGAAPYLIPISVDGLVVVASVCLVELAGRIRTSEAPTLPVAEPVADMPQIAETPAEPVTADPEPASAPVRKPARRRATPPVLTAADRVADAHAKDPAATHARIAEAAGVSVATVKRHRPRTGSPSAPSSAQTLPTDPAPAVPVPVAA